MSFCVNGEKNFIKMFSSLDKYYDISLTDREIDELVEKNEDLSNEITNQYELNNIDRSICWLAGLTAGAMDFFLISKPRGDGYLTKKTDSLFRNFISDDQRVCLEKNNWVPYDPATNKHLGKTVENLTLNPKTHRLQSLGHDPIMGFFYGVKDILRHTFTVFDNNGNLLTIARNGHAIETNIFGAIFRQIGHILSDISTPSGLPIPFWGVLQKCNFGSIDNRTISQMSKLMYARGYNLNHLVGMSIPAITIELIVRSCYFINSFVIEKKSISDSLPFNRPKLDKLLFNAYIVSIGCNSVKLMSQNGNIFAFNPTLWLGATRYGIKEFKRYLTDEKERNRHKYVMDIYEKESQILDHEINNHLEYYI